MLDARPAPRLKIRAHVSRSAQIGRRRRGQAAPGSGELYEQSAEDLLCDAVDEALTDAGCPRERIEAAWVGTVMSTFGGDALADALKLFGRPDDPGAELLRLGDGRLPERLPRGRLGRARRRARRRLREDARRRLPTARTAATP